MEKLHLTISGMTCNHCVMSVRKALASLDGVAVEDVSVGAATVSHDTGRASTDDVIKAITQAGYTVVSVN